jgi:hypothetical protein
MPARCSYPVSGSKHDGTLRLCGESATHTFDLSSSYLAAERPVCLLHRSDPSLLFPGKSARLIGTEAK